MPTEDPRRPLARSYPQTLDEAEARGKQVLLYQPEGMLGGTFTCARCGVVAVQPDLLVHASGCRYAKGSESITVW